MTNDELRRRMASLADARDERRRAIDGDARPPVSAADRLAAPFRVGDGVLDLVSGREGRVFDVGVPDRQAAIVVVVKFPDGGSVSRLARELVARPTPPAARQ
jgi:hypothetical protein